MYENDTSKLSPASIAERVAGGDKSAEKEMVEKYQAGLYAVLFNKARDKVVVEEVLQDTWIVVLSKVRARELRDPSKLAQFIIQVGKNQLTMFFRRQSTHYQRNEPYEQELAADRLSIEQELENAELGKVIAKLFEQLPTDRDRELLGKFYLSGETKSNLCENYQLSSAHFDRVIYRARQRFVSLWHQSRQEKIN